MTFLELFFVSSNVKHLSTAAADCLKRRPPDLHCHGALAVRSLTSGFPKQAVSMPNPKGCGYDGNAAF